MESNITAASAARTQEILKVFGGNRQPSIRKAYKKGFAYNAIIEAVDGEKAIKEKTARLGRLLSMTHLLTSEAILLMDEADAMLDKKVKEAKHFRDYTKSINFYFERWRESLGPLISAEQMKCFNEDFNAFDANVRSYAKLEGWKTQTKEDKVKGLKERNKNLHREFMNNLLDLKELVGEKEVEEFLNEIKKMDI